MSKFGTFSCTGFYLVICWNFISFVFGLVYIDQQIIKLHGKLSVNGRCKKWVVSIKLFILVSCIHKMAIWISSQCENYSKKYLHCVKSLVNLTVINALCCVSNLLQHVHTTNILKVNCGLIQFKRAVTPGFWWIHMLHFGNGAGIMSPTLWQEIDSENTQ